jgi:cyanophycinase
MRKLCALAPALLCSLAPAFCFEGRGHDYFLTGNKQDVQPRPQPGVLLAGGGKEVDDAFDWFLAKAAGGDVVVLRASGTNEYHPYFTKRAKLDSVETFVFRSAEASSDPFVLQRIRGAEAIFIAGGDQWNYVKFWKDSPVEDAIHEALRRGVPIGGTSAGLAILGQFAFSAEHDTVTSAEALENPFSDKVSISEGFLELPQLRCLITDSHFSRRDRMGRLLVFLARIRNENHCDEVRGLGVDERTAVLLEPNNRARVVGEGSAYLLRLSTPAGLKAVSRATVPPVAVIAVAGGQNFDAKRWRGGPESAHYKLSITDGIVNATRSAHGIY